MNKVIVITAKHSTPAEFTNEGLNNFLEQHPDAELSYYEGDYYIIA